MKAFHTRYDTIVSSICILAQTIVFQTRFLMQNSFDEDLSGFALVEYFDLARKVATFDRENQSYDWIIQFECIQKLNF